MSTKAKAKALADDMEDSEVALMLEPGSSSSDPAQWLADKNGDLDWDYTARTVREWSTDALLNHLWKNAFSIPAREYNPSAPFVWVKNDSGDSIVLPHGYRLPLMFVAKYCWEVTFKKVGSEDSWRKAKGNVFHLSRLCQNLFRRAKAKKELRGGMEKGWRCLMFDRLLARFYKHWSRNDPVGGKKFLVEHSVKEYDRDVLKHDWKRWCLRGLDGVKMTDDEVANGITIEQFRQKLKKPDDGLWMLNDKPLTWITTERSAGTETSSELTDYDMEDEESSDPDADGDLEADPPTIQSNDAQGKRPRRFAADEDEEERAAKRARIQAVSPEIQFPFKHTQSFLTRAQGRIGSSSSPHLALPSNAARPLGISNGDETQPDTTIETNPPLPAIANGPQPQPSETEGQNTAVPQEGGISTSAVAPEPVDVNEPSISASSPPKPKPRFKMMARNNGPAKRQPPPPSISREASVESTSAEPPDPVNVKAASTSASAPPKTKPRQFKTTPRTYGPTTRQRPAPSTSAKRPRQQPPAASKPRRIQPPRNMPSFRPPRPVTSSSSSSSESSDSSPPPVAPPQPPTVDNADSTVPHHALTAKALELLVNLVDAKQLLDSDKQAASSSSVTTHPPPVNVADTSSPEVVMDHRVFESRFHDFEGRILSVKEELMGIVGRLQAVEKTTREQAELERKKRELEFRDMGVNCRPLAKEQSIQTETVMGTDGDVVMREPSLDVTVSNTQALRAFGEISVQTDEEQRPEELTFPEQESVSQPATRPPSVSAPCVEVQTIVDSNSSSETDTDTTAINISSFMKEEPLDPKTQIMSSNLSLFVNNLVSAKMLAVTENMAKNKPKESTVSESDLLRLSSPPVAGSSVADVLEEFKAMKEDALAREQRDKEELQALRELHSAEVDALRRRLYFLESQNRHPESSTSVSANARYRSTSSNPAHGENNLRHHHHISVPVPRDRNEEGPSNNRQKNPHTSEHSQVSPVEEVVSTPPSRTPVTTKKPMLTPTPSERTYSFALPSRERDDEIPLPIKSQRKQHIMFPRPSFG